MAAHDFGTVVERLRRSTVRILDGRRGIGSGVVWDAGGRIVTNAHVARRGRVTIECWDGRQLRGTVAARDPQRDLALIEAPAPELVAATASDSSRLRPGEVVLAVGNPLGFIGALTQGVVHAVGPLPGLGPYAWVQADVRLAPGNSGGPLANAKGEVAGINTMIAAGLALAIPSNAVRRFVSTAGGGQSARAPLGVVVRPVALRAAAGAGAGAGAAGFGLMLLEVNPGTPAERASLLPGDIVTGIDGAPLGSLDDFSDRLAGGGAVRLQFRRGADPHERQVTVALGGAPGLSWPLAGSAGAAA